MAGGSRPKQADTSTKGLGHCGSSHCDLCADGCSGKKRVPERNDLRANLPGEAHNRLLEPQFQSELNVARSARTEHGVGTHHIRSTAGTAEQSPCACPGIDRARHPEVDPIEKVEELHAEL